MKRTTLSLIAAATALAAVTGFAALTAPDGTTTADTAKPLGLPVERTTLLCPVPSSSEVAETTYTSYTPPGQGAGSAQGAGGKATGGADKPADKAELLPSTVALVATDGLSFGDAVPARYVEFVDEMLSATPFGVVADFFPTFGTLEKFETVHAMSSVPTAIICGTADKLTPIEHSRRLHELIQGSTLLECEGAGHMVMLERHDQVNAELDQLLAAAGDLVDRR